MAEAVPAESDRLKRKSGYNNKKPKGCPDIIPDSLLVHACLRPASGGSLSGHFVIEIKGKERLFFQGLQ
ncbi:hypothetical protein [Sporosarcina sp. UB5]|uniref:hypothetical protein n=1 Tax=Sporosarcina sp. UB5 TaxID=3047463 RepID=UPI003D78B3FF